MSPAFAYIALIGGLLYIVTGVFGLWAATELSGWEIAAGAEDPEEAEAALAGIRFWLILVSATTALIGAAGLAIAFGLFAQRLWAIYGWLALISLVAAWTVVEFFLGGSGWLGTLLTVLVAVWSWVEYRTAALPETGEFTVQGAIGAAIGSMTGTVFAFAAFCLAGMVIGVILGLVGEHTGILLLSGLPGTGIGFLTPVALLALLWFTLLSERESVRLALLSGASLTVALAIYATAI